MRSGGSFRAILLASLLSVVATFAFAQQPAANPEASEGDADATAQIPPQIASAIGGLSGLVSATTQRIELGRSSDRLSLIRAAITSELLASGATGPIKLTGLTADTLLCSARENHAVEVADRSYVAAVSSTIQKTATPTKIETFGAAVSSLMQSYSLDIPEGKTAKEIKTGVSDRCKADFPSFARQYYGVPNQKVADAAERNQEAGLLDFISPVTALFSALNAIVTPILTGVASAVDENRRIEAIAEYFRVKKNRDQVTAAAKRLGELADNFTTENRLSALGRFSENLAALRGLADPSKVDACKTAFKTSGSRGSYVPIPGNLTEKSFVPSDDFLRCYQKLWGQVSEQVATMLKAADDYDQFADASGASAAASKIASYLDKLQNPPAVTLKDLWASAVKLLAFADTVNKALSEDNQAKLKLAITNLAKLQ